VTTSCCPAQIAKVEYPDVAYAHQGWLTDDQSHFMMGDELDEGDGRPTRTLIFDVTDLDAARFVGAHEATTPAIDHNMYVKDGLVYQSNYAAGLRVLDTARSRRVASRRSRSSTPSRRTTSRSSSARGRTTPYFASGTIAVSGIDDGPVPA
jgi:choice-of-anchor B domain-containing protein